MQPVRFTDTGIEFRAYPYPGARVFPRGSVGYDEIESLDPEAAPPELRLRGGETLFVPATQREELAAAAEQRGLVVRARVDVWALILEPFLDTQFDWEHQERTLARLEDNGVPRAEVSELRRALRDRMVAYNAIHWDWVHLGLCDVLDAHLGRLLPAWVPLVHARFRRFYRRAMEIASRGQMLSARTA